MSHQTPLMSIDSMIETHSLEFTQGSQVDSFFVYTLFNALDFPRRFANAFELLTKNPQLWLMIARDAAHLHDLSPENMLIAEFPPSADLPFHRLYCYRYGAPFAASREALTSILSSTAENASVPGLTVRYSDRADVTRAGAWVDELRRALAPTTLVAEGRIQNTTIEQVRVLYRQRAGCVLCGDTARGYVGSTIGWPSSILFIANTCKAHQAIAKNHPTVLHFIFQLFQLNLDLGTIQKSHSIPDCVIPFLRDLVGHELDASPVGTATKNGQTTLTFERKSGFRVILRLRTLMNYAYMLDAPDGEPFRRIDAAPDHTDIPFFPDHLHLAPKTDNSNVVSSFTYGFPLLDLPLVQRLLQEGEQAFAAQST